MIEKYECECDQRVVTTLSTDYPNSQPFISTSTESALKTASNTAYPKITN